jgi:hypothetical protein
VSQHRVSRKPSTGNRHGQRVVALEYLGAQPGIASNDSHDPRNHHEMSGDQRDHHYNDPDRTTEQARTPPVARHHTTCSRAFQHLNSVTACRRSVGHA